MKFTTLTFTVLVIPPADTVSVVCPNFDVVGCHHKQMAFHRESFDAW